MSDYVIDRAVKMYLDGMQPWHCQKCGYRACDLCGEPYVRLAYGDFVFDDGGRGYYSPGPNLGASPGCINPECKKYRNLS